MTATPEDIRWCRSTFESLVDGGVWGVPRSGLVFQRRGERLVLIERMPFIDELREAAAEGRDVPPTAEGLLAYQDQDLAGISERFRAAGIPVEDASSAGASAS